MKNGLQEPLLKALGALPARLARSMPGHVALQGNLDPFALVAGSVSMRHERRLCTPPKADLSYSIWDTASCRRLRLSMWPLW